jgi:hypothetical protein
VELAGDTTRRPMLAPRETMNFVDLITLEHGCGYKLTPGARPEGCSLQAAGGARRGRLTGLRIKSWESVKLFFTRSSAAGPSSQTSAGERFRLRAKLFFTRFWRRWRWSRTCC